MKRIFVRLSADTRAQAVVRAQSLGSCTISLLIDRISFNARTFYQRRAHA
jgi:hypothetical protein